MSGGTGALPGVGGQRVVLTFAVAPALQRHHEMAELIHTSS